MCKCEWVAEEVEEEPDYINGYRIIRRGNPKCIKQCESCKSKLDK
jgi:hypothetical protein